MIGSRFNSLSVIQIYFVNFGVFLRHTDIMKIPYLYCLAVSAINIAGFAYKLAYGNCAINSINKCITC